MRYTACLLPSVLSPQSIYCTGDLGQEVPIRTPTCRKSFCGLFSRHSRLYFLSSSHLESSAQDLMQAQNWPFRRAAASDSALAISLRSRASVRACVCWASCSASANLCSTCGCKPPLDGALALARMRFFPDPPPEPLTRAPEFAASRFPVLVFGVLADNIVHPVTLRSRLRLGEPV